MNVRHIFAVGTVSLALVGVGFGIAQAPIRNIDPKRNPNLAAAQRLIDDAYHKISDAQRANEFDMSGHAQRAKELLDQANRELGKAAEAADRK